MRLAFALAAALAAAAPPLPEVVMGEYVVARAADVPEVRTYGVGPCLALALYDAGARVGALAHVSPPDDIPASVDAMLAALESAGADRRRLTARVVGGWRKGDDPLFSDTDFTSPRMLEALAAALARRGVSADVSGAIITIDRGVPPDRVVRSVRLDLRSGSFEDLPPGSRPAGPARTVTRDERAPALMRPFRF